MFNLASLSLSLYCSVLFGLVAAYLLITSVAQYWRLRHIPGPPLAAWTNLWLIRAMHHKVNFHIQEERLHQRYGPVQRYGPNRVLFSDPAAIPVILGSTNIFLKAPNHGPVKAFVNGSEVLSFIAETDDAKAARLKRNLHASFSVAGVLAYEQHVNHTVTEMVSHLRANGPTADLSEWCTWFAFDTMARIAFSEDQGFMTKQQDIGGAVEAARKRFEHWNFYWSIPWLDTLLYKNYFARRSKRAPSGLMKLAIRAINSRQQKGGLGTHDDILDLFLKCGKADPKLFTPQTIIGLTITTIQAGSETTGYTVAICLYNLLANPQALSRLRKEIGEVSEMTEEGWTLPPSSVLRSCQYLEACVKESNRITPTVNIPSERVVPAGGRTIAGVFVPGGTIVGNNTAGMYMDPAIWGADVEAYRPERWLEASEEQRIRMNKATLLFSAGKRMCLGLNVSWLEMRKVIPALVMNFEMALVHPENGLWQKPGIFAEPDEILVNISPRKVA